METNKEDPTISTDTSENESRPTKRARHEKEKRKVKLMVPYFVPLGAWGRTQLVWKEEIYEKEIE